MSDENIEQEFRLLRSGRKVKVTNSKITKIPDNSTKNEMKDAPKRSFSIKLDRNFVKNYLDTQSKQSDWMTKNNGWKNSHFNCFTFTDDHFVRSLQPARKTGVENNKITKISDNLTTNELDRKKKTLLTDENCDGKRKSSEFISNDSKRMKFNQMLKTPSKRAAMKRTQKMQLLPNFHPFELVWAYVRGYPKWPGVIEGIRPDGKYIIHFFGDYSRAFVSRKNIFHYLEGFSQFGNTDGNVRLRKAVQEAQIFLLDTQSQCKDCFVCKVLEFKQMYSNSRSLMA